MTTTTALPPAEAGAPEGPADHAADATGDVDARLRRRLRPLHLATLLQGVMLWVPVEKLFMAEIGFDPTAVGVMAAAYAGVVPLLEVPSGVLADRWSRRGVLVLATLALLVSSAVGGLSHDVPTYVVGAMFLGVYFALQSGTLDAVVYDTVLEETGGGAGFERRIGRVRLLEGVALVASALAGGWLASLTAPRAMFFLTLPFLLASIGVLLTFREPRLHRAEEPVPLRSHVATTYRAMTRCCGLVPLIGVMVVAAVVANLLLEFGPLWLLAASAPAVLYGPHFAGLGSSFGVAGLLAGRLRLDRRVAGVAVAAMVASGLVLVAVHDPVVVTVAQVVLVVVAVLLGILLGARLHDAVPSAVRSSVASGVGTLTWAVFLPVALLFGRVADRVGVHRTGWLVLALVAVAGALLLRVTGPGGRAHGDGRGPSAGVGEPGPLGDQVAGPVEGRAPGREEVVGGAGAGVEHGQEQVLATDDRVAEVDRLAEAQLQHLHRGAVDAEVAAATAGGAGAVERALTEGGLGPAADGVEVDAQRRQRGGVERRAGRALDQVEAVAEVVDVDRPGLEQGGGGGGVVEQAVEQVLGADRVGVPAAGLGDGLDHAEAGGLVEPFQHRSSLTTRTGGTSCGRPGG